MDAESTVGAYYDALRAEEPLAPFFATDTDPVKVGIGERLVGGEAVRDGLQAQTAHTTGWDVETRDLRVTERDRHAWFADDVFLSWTDTDRNIRFSFDTRWTGTLERDEDWRFVGMHVSTAGEV